MRHEGTQVATRITVQCRLGATTGLQFEFRARVSSPAIRTSTSDGKKTTPPVGATGGVGRSSRKTAQVAKGYDVGAVSFSFFFSSSLGGAFVGLAVTLYCRSGV